MLASGARAWFRAQVLCLTFVAHNSVRGPGAQFRARGSIQGPGARFGAQVLGSGPRCSVQGPGAQFGTWVLLNPQILQVFEKVLSSPFSLVSGLTWSAEAKAYPRSISGTDIMRVKEARYLGIILDDKLNFKEQFNKLIKKLKEAINCLICTRNILNWKAKMMLYSALSNPISPGLWNDVLIWGVGVKSSRPYFRLHKLA